MCVCVFVCFLGGVGGMGQLEWIKQPLITFNIRAEENVQTFNLLINQQFEILARLATNL